jgi:hypothetical protein
VTANIWHSCTNYSLEYHFEGKDHVLREIFDKIAEAVNECGPATVYAQKTRIVFQVRVRFAGAVVHKHSLDASLWLTRKADHPCLSRIESFNARDHGHRFKFTETTQVDARFRGLVREAYEVGKREHLKPSASPVVQGGQRRLTRSAKKR